MNKIKQLFHTSKTFLSSLINKNKSNSIEDLQLQIENLQHSKVLDSHLSNMLKGVLSINNLRARDLMVPRAHIDYFEIDDDLDHILTNVLAHGHSRFPVLSEDQESIGLLFAKDLLKYLTEREVQEARELHELLQHEESLNGLDASNSGATINLPSHQSPTHAADLEALTQVQLPDEQNHIIDNNGFNLRNIIKPVSIIPESKRVTTLLQEFQTNHTHLALVVNEFGEISGLITIEDILEEIVGEISDEFDINEVNIRQISKTTFEVMATTYLEEFNEKFNIDLDSEEFDTIGGYIVNLLGYVPNKNEVIELENGRLILRVIVVEESRKIVKFRVRCNNLKGTEKPVDGSVVDINEVETFAEQMHEEGNLANEKLAQDTANANDHTPRIAKKLKDIVQNVSSVIDEKTEQLRERRMQHADSNSNTDHQITHNSNSSTSRSEKSEFSNSMPSSLEDSAVTAPAEDPQYYHMPQTQEPVATITTEEAVSTVTEDTEATTSIEETSTEVATPINANTKVDNHAQATSQPDLSTNPTKTSVKKSLTLETPKADLESTALNSSNQTSVVSTASATSDHDINPNDQDTTTTNHLSDNSTQGNKNGLFKSTTRSTKTTSRESGNKNCRSEKLSEPISRGTKRETSSSECRERSNPSSDCEIRSISSEREPIRSERRSDRSGQISTGRSEKQIWLLNPDQTAHNSANVEDQLNSDPTTASSQDHITLANSSVDELARDTIMDTPDSEPALVLDKDLNLTTQGVIMAEEQTQRAVQKVLQEISPETDPNLASDPTKPDNSMSSPAETPTKPKPKKRKRNGGKR